MTSNFTIKDCSTSTLLLYSFVGRTAWALETQNIRKFREMLSRIAHPEGAVPG